MANKIKKIISALLVLVMLVNFASAITIRSITADAISPNKEGTISVEIKNNLNDTAEDISMVLDFTNLPFNPVGSSEDSISELDEDDTDELIFTVKATNDITPGDYKIPFTLLYTIDNAQKQSKGAIGLTVKANPELSFSLSSSNPIINQQGKLTLKISKNINMEENKLKEAQIWLKDYKRGDYKEILNRQKVFQEQIQKGKINYPAS